MRHRHQWHGQYFACVCKHLAAQDCADASLMSPTPCQDLLTFSPVQVGGRGLECQMPEDLAQVIYGAELGTGTGSTGTGGSTSTGTGGSTSTGTGGSTSTGTGGSTSTGNRVVLPPFETITFRLEHATGDQPYVTSTPRKAVSLTLCVPF
jgi:hypothetical protein